MAGHRRGSDHGSENSLEGGQRAGCGLSLWGRRSSGDSLEEGWRVRFWISIGGEGLSETPLEGVWRDDQNFLEGGWRASFGILVRGDEGFSARFLYGGRHAGLLTSEKQVR